MIVRTADNVISAVINVFAFVTGDSLGLGHDASSSIEGLLNMFECYVGVGRSLIVAVSVVESILIDIPFT